jgi:hypothetical protein
MINDANVYAAFTEINNNGLRYIDVNDPASMKRPKLKFILIYLYQKATGSFMGFLIGMASSSLVSRFFETRSLRNLWGLTAKKTLISKKMFGNLEWIASILIGFLVFEIFTKVVKKKLDELLARYKYPVMRWVINKDLKNKVRHLQLQVTSKKVSFFSSIHIGVQQAFNRLSKRWH